MAEGSNIQMPTLTRRIVLPYVLGFAVLTAATVGGLALGEEGADLFGGILGASANSSNLLGDFGSFLGFGIAFGAGMVAAVNPCGFVMLPVYLGLYIGQSGNRTGASVVRRLLQALIVSTVVGLGFVLLFGVTGVAISAGAQRISTVFPWIGLGLGFALALGGSYLLAGGKLYTGAAQRAADRIGKPGDASVKGYFLFGVSYGLASLSCTLPIFLALVSGSFASGGFVSAVGQFLLYAGGMAFIITVLTVGMALAKGAVAGGMQKLLPYMGPVSGWLLVLVGAYIVFYWLTEGGLAARIG